MLTCTQSDCTLFKTKPTQAESNQTEFNRVKLSLSSTKKQCLQATQPLASAEPRKTEVSAQQLYALSLHIRDHTPFISSSILKPAQTVADGGPDDQQSDPSYAGDDGKAADPR